MDTKKRIGILRRISSKGFIVRAAMLGGVTLVAMAIILPIGWMFTGSQAGIEAGAVAAGTCLLAAWIAMAATEKLSKPTQLLTKVGVGMFSRMGIPLFAALLAHFSGVPLAAAGFLYYIVAFYPVTLAAEVLFSLPQGNLNH